VAISEEELAGSAAGALEELSSPQPTSIAKETMAMGRVIFLENIETLLLKID
jgi:hypothetical protein